MRGITQDTIIIDCCTGLMATSLAFWSRALDMMISDDAEDGYRRLQSELGGPEVVLHQVDRVGAAKLDVETDDLDAEAVRLQQLGARRTAFARYHWWAMEAPGGQPFRLVQVSRASTARSRGSLRHASHRSAPRLRKRA